MESQEFQIKSVIIDRLEYPQPQVAGANIGATDDLLVCT